MKTATQIQQDLQDAQAEVDAVCAVAEREERELNAEETKRVTELVDVAIPAMNAQLKTAMKIQTERNNRLTARVQEELKQTESITNELNQERSNPVLAAVRVPAKAKNHGVLKAYVGADAEREAYIAGRVILAGVYGHQDSSNWCRQHGLAVQANMNTSSNTAGGFLVPDEMLRTIIRLREERGVFPKYANRVPMGTDIIKVPRLLSDTTAYWGSETGTLTASTAGLGQAELMARKLYSLTKVSSELDEDAVIDIGDIVTQSMAYAMADKVDDAAFNGDGTSSYGGVLGLRNALNASAIQDALTGNNSALTLDLDDFQAALGKVGQYSGASNRWYMHSAVYYAACARLMDAAGGNTNMTIANGIPTPMFLGYPVTFVQVMTSTTGTAASTILAYFGDLRLGATYGTRRSSRVEVSTERYFDEDMIGIKTTERLAILVHERGDTIRNRPIVALKTAA